MKYLLAIAIFLLVYSCINKNKSRQNVSEVKRDSLHARPDSFNFSDLISQPSIQDGIILDTVIMEPTKKYLEIRIILPKLIEKDSSDVYNQVKNLAKIIKRQFIESIEDTVKYDSTIGLLQGYNMWIEPKSLYKTDKVLSFAIENGEGYGGMSSSFEFTMINLDREKKKQIRLQDYFILKTSSDTAWFSDIVCKSLNWGKPDEVIKYLKFLGPVKFAFDEENIYFFFDRGELFAGGQIGSVKKKYITDHIKEEYR